MILRHVGGQDHHHHDSITVNELPKKDRFFAPPFVSKGMLWITPARALGGIFLCTYKDCNLIVIFRAPHPCSKVITWHAPSKIPSFPLMALTRLIFPARTGMFRLFRDAESVGMRFPFDATGPITALSCVRISLYRISQGLHYS